MNAKATRASPQPDARTRLLDAAMQVIREQGYSATTVDDICGAAGLTKGAFFHHFKSKEDLGVAATAHFAEMAEQLFGGAPYHELADPLDRLLGYIDFRAAILTGPIAGFTCLLGTMVQETFETHPAIREVCGRYISAHAAMLARDIAQAKARHAPSASFSAESLALYTQAVIQGAFILAKARNGPQIAGECLDHLRRYIEMLFNKSANRGVSA
jgi:TetR/AcrR family transcriptional repressor of nem operon